MVALTRCAQAQADSGSGPRESSACQTRSLRRLGLCGLPDITNGAGARAMDAHIGTASPSSLLSDSREACPSGLPSATNFVVLGGRRLCFAELGTSRGYPVIALHGTPGSRFKHAAA